MSIKVVSIDIAKNLFQICVLNTDGQILSNSETSFLILSVNYQSKLLLRWNHVQLRITGEEYFKT
jgi:hypothetical protein